MSVIDTTNMEIDILIGLAEECEKDCTLRKVLEARAQELIQRVHQTEEYYEQGHANGLLC